MTVPPAPPAEPPAAAPVIGQPPAALPPGTPPAPAPEKTYASYEEWFAEQPGPTQDLVNGQIGRLQTALKSERELKEVLDKDLKKLRKGVEEGSDQAATLDKLRGDLAESTTRAAFGEAAHAAGVTNLRLAYIAAKDADLIGTDGKVDFKALKVAIPELFRQPAAPAAPPPPPTPPGGAGAGTGNPVPEGPKDMNALIRAQVGIT